MTARAVDNGGAGTSVAAMDAIRNSSRRGDAAARGERGSRSRRAVILRADCSDESSETVTLASIARRTIPGPVGRVEKTACFRLAKRRKELKRDARCRTSTRGGDARSSHAPLVLVIPATPRSNGGRHAVRRDRTGSRRTRSDEVRARTNVPGAVFPPSFVPRKCREATRSWHADHANSPPARLPLTRHAPRAAPRRPAAMFATTPSAAAPAGGSPDWLDRQVARETHERVDVSARTPGAPPRVRGRGREASRVPLGAEAQVRARRSGSHRRRRGRLEHATSPRRGICSPTSPRRRLRLPARHQRAPRRRRGGRGPGGPRRFAPIGGGGLSLQDLIAGKNGAEPGRTEGRAEVFSPSPAARGRNGARARRARRGAAAKKQKGGWWRRTTRRRTPTMRLLRWTSSRWPPRRRPRAPARGRERVAREGQETPAPRRRGSAGRRASATATATTTGTK